MDSRTEVAAVDDGRRHKGNDFREESKTSKGKKIMFIARFISY